MRRRYNDYVEKYKEYTIYQYIRGEYTRFGAEDGKEDLVVEADDIQEIKDYIDKLDNEFKSENFDNDLTDEVEN